ncbi:MAG: hypothetical protein JWL74_1125 [Alphaproteobacteria bacterium]|nr:hypothetical protein [Alphaproteobacteria bacterium]
MEKPSYRVIEQDGLGPDIGIAAIPERPVAALRFHGGPDGAAPGNREAQLKSWVGAKKLEAMIRIE